MKSLLLLTLLAGLVTTAQAGTIVLASSPANTTNSKGVPTISIAKNPAWADPLAGSTWISYAITGDPSAPGYTVVPNGAGDAVFTQTFSLTGAITAANLSVMADDTTSVILNGNTIFAVANPAGGYPTCSADPIGCLASTRKDFNFAQLSPFFVQGVNTLQFGVVQRAGSSFGLDYAGSVTTTPEPGSLTLLGSGLIAAVAFARRKKGQA